MLAVVRYASTTLSLFALVTGVLCAAVVLRVVGVFWVSSLICIYSTRDDAWAVNSCSASRRRLSRATTLDYPDPPSPPLLYLEVATPENKNSNSKLSYDMQESTHNVR